MNSDTCKKIKLIMLSFKMEYKNIEALYCEKKIYKKSIPIKAKKGCDKTQQKDLERFIGKTFISSFLVLSKMIDAGIVEISAISEKVDLKQNKLDKDIFEKLVYESWDKLYINKYIKYNIIMSFIMQLYIIFEKEIIFYMHSIYEKEFTEKTLFSTLEFIEKKFQIEFASELKKDINIYRNVINVHKHGKGESYYWIKDNYPEIMNEKVEASNLDTTFLFNLEKISFMILFNKLNEVLDSILSLKFEAVIKT